MASALPSGAVEVVQVATTTTDGPDCVDLTALPGLIESLTVDSATGEDGVNRAMRSLFTCLCKSCENDNLALFETVLSCINCTDMIPSIESELLRSSILNGSFRCSRYLVHQVQNANLCSVVSWMCVRDWDEITFKTLVDRGFSLDDCACKGMGALKHCIINGNEELVQVCLQHGCSANALQIELPPDDDHTPEVAVDEFSPLMCAILYANSGIVEKLLQHGADLTVPEKCGMSTLEAAVYASKVKETALIVNAYKQALETHPENCNLFETDVQKSFVNAVTMKYSSSVKECMRILIRAGADVNKTDQHGCSPLLLAIDANEPDTVAFLLQNGCDVNITGNVPDTENNDGFRQVSPLDLACSQSEVSMLDLVLKAGAVIGQNVFENEEHKKRIKLCWKSFTLADWCRVIVRQKAQLSSLETHVEEMELPTTLKQFLSMSD